MKRLDNDSLRYQARVYKQKCIQEQALEDIKKIAYTCIGDRGKFIVHEANKGEVFNGYGFGTRNEKQGHKWMGELQIHETSYRFFGDSELNLWCNLISKLLGENDWLYFPSVI